MPNFDVKINPSNAMNTNCPNVIRLPEPGSILCRNEDKNSSNRFDKSRFRNFTHLTMYSRTTTLTQHPTNTPKIASTTRISILIRVSILLFYRMSAARPRQILVNLLKIKQRKMWKKIKNFGFSQIFYIFAVTWAFFYSRCVRFAIKRKKNSTKC